MPELICSADDPRWLAERRKGITATDITAVLGLVPYDSPYSLYWRKTGDLPELEDNDRLRLGRVLEDYVLTRWSEAYPSVGLQLTAGACLWRSLARPWQLATPDLLTRPLDEPIEVKTWADAGKPGWGDTGTADVPPRVRAQVLWQMDVMDVAAGHVGVLFLPSGEFRSYVIEHEPTYAGSEWGCNGDTCSPCADLILMRAAGKEFMARLRHELPPPDLDGSVATLAALKGRYPDARKGKTVPIPDALWARWTEARNARDAAECEQRLAEAEMRELTGEAADIEVDGQVVGRRIVNDQHIKAHARHMDFIKRVGSKNDE